MRRTKMKTEEALLSFCLYEFKWCGCMCFKVRPSYMLFLSRRGHKQVVVERASLYCVPTLFSVIPILSISSLIPVQIHDGWSFETFETDVNDIAGAYICNVGYPAYLVYDTFSYKYERETGLYVSELYNDYYDYYKDE